jgi:hypothetical protein
MPMPVGDDALIVVLTARKAGHVGFRTGFVNNHQTLGIELLLPVYPLLPTLLCISPILLAGR